MREGYYRLRNVCIFLLTIIAIVAICYALYRRF